MQLSSLGFDSWVNAKKKSLFQGNVKSQATFPQMTKKKNQDQEGKKKKKKTKTQKHVFFFY